MSSVSWCTIQLSFAPLTAGALTGSVVISSNDPVNPQLTIGLTGTGDLINGVPSILANSAPTVLLNNGPTTLQLTGTNFYPQSVAQVNGVAQTTTFLDNGDLKVTIAASLLTSLGELQLSVVNPAPGGGSSQAITVTPYETLLIEPAAVASVPATGLLYAAIPASAAANPNTVIPVDPKTGTPGTPIPVGKDPRLLAASSDGAYLYVANQADFTLQRINLKTNAVERTFPYTPNIDCPSCSNVSATDLATIPGSPQEVLLSQGSSLTLYNDAGSVNYVPNDGICCRADPDFIVSFRQGCVTSFRQPC
jgi:DNA-binding beta-propeller fold protein YncE